MATAGESVTNIPWWKEPTRDQWYAFVAAWLGWTLDAFDFTVFLLIMDADLQTFHVSLTAVTFVFTITLWMRLIGATTSGWVGRSVRTQDAADDLDPRLLRLQLRRRIFPDVPVSAVLRARCSGCSWARNGRPAPRWQWRPGRSVRAGL